MHYRVYLEKKLKCTYFHVIKWLAGKK